MHEIKVLKSYDFSTFLSIIGARGEAPEDYYRWKFFEQSDSIRPVGFLTKEESVDLGCIGLLNYQLHIPGQMPLKANWFADWFVTDSARGKGIGKQLMESCAASADIGFGIPGPEHAQKVAGKSGYELNSGFVELQIPIRPTRVGFKRFGGSLLKKSLRSLKFNLAYFKSFAFKKKQKVILQWGKPSIGTWSLACKRLLNNKTHLIRTEFRLTHFFNMPVVGERQWWYYDTKDCFVAGFVETDVWGLRRAKILDFVCDTAMYSQLFTGILHALRKKQIDLVLTIANKEELQQLSVKQLWIFPIPLHMTSKYKTRLDYLSNLDKESSWRDMNFN